MNTSKAKNMFSFAAAAALFLSLAFASPAFSQEGTKPDLNGLEVSVEVSLSQTGQMTSCRVAPEEKLPAQQAMAVCERLRALAQFEPQKTADGAPVASKRNIVVFFQDNGAIVMPAGSETKTGGPDVKTNIEIEATDDEEAAAAPGPKKSEIKPIGGGNAQAERAESAAPAANAPSAEAPAGETPTGEEAAAQPAAGASSVKTAGVKVGDTNDIVRFEVNAETEAAGRFSVKTVGGDPNRETDDNQSLIYSGPVPVTSFTTVYIDGQLWAFGGQTQKRAGRRALYGKVIEGPKKRWLGEQNFEVFTACELGPIVVRQTLRITNGPSSKLKDSAEIEYEILNADKQPHRIGLRVMLDTLLGKNDGAPLQIGLDSITTERKLQGEAVPDSWVAYDSFDHPGVVARGTLRGKDLTPPNQLHIADWGTLADNIWLAPYSPGKPFKREGEFELDSAIALYWDPEVVASGAKRNIKTLYGIDYYNFKGEDIGGAFPDYLGEHSTAKNQIVPVLLSGTVENTSSKTFYNVRAELSLPEGLELAEGSSALQPFGQMEGGARETPGWWIQPKPFAEGSKIIMVRIKAQAHVTVEFPVRIDLLSPPGLEGEITMKPETLQVIGGAEYRPDPFEVHLNIRNKGQSPIDKLRAELILPENSENGVAVRFAEVQKPVIERSRMDGMGSDELIWLVKPVGDISGDIPVSVRLTSDSIEETIIKGFLSIPPLQTRLQFVSNREQPKVGEPLIAEVLLSSAKNFREADVSISYNPDVLYFQGPAARGTICSSSDWHEPMHDRTFGTLKHANCSWEGVDGFTGSRTIMSLRFMVEHPGDAGLAIDNFVLRDASGKPIDTNVMHKVFIAPSPDAKPSGATGENAPDEIIPETNPPDPGDENTQ